MTQKTFISDADKVFFIYDLHFHAYLQIDSEGNITFTRKRERMDSSRVEKIDFYRDNLKKETAMQVHVPAGYDEFSRLPVLYFTWKKWRRKYNVRN